MGRRLGSAQATYLGQPRAKLSPYPMPYSLTYRAGNYDQKITPCDAQEQRPPDPRDCPRPIASPSSPSPCLHMYSPSSFLLNTSQPKYLPSSTPYLSLGSLSLSRSLALSLELAEVRRKALLHSLIAASFHEFLQASAPSPSTTLLDVLTSCRGTSTRRTRTSSSRELADSEAAAALKDVL